MAKAKVEINKNTTQQKKDIKKDTKPVKEKVNNEVQEEDIDIEKEQTKKTRGREKGFTVETPKAIINITDTYRIDESDGRNKIIQRLIIKIRTKDEKDDEDNKGVKIGEEYKKWVNVLKCFRSDYKSAFFRLHEVMVEDEVKKREEVSLDEFLKIYREMNILLDKTFPVKEK